MSEAVDPSEPPDFPEPKVIAIGITSITYIIDNTPEQIAEAQEKIAEALRTMLKCYDETGWLGEVEEPC